jgi:hypothetical protein
VEFIAYIDREGDREWPPREQPPGESVRVDVTPETTFGDAVAKALRAAGDDVWDLYSYGADQGPIYWPTLLREATDPGSGLLPFPKVAIAGDGQFIWTWGARERATFADYVRARDANYFEGDPYGVFLARPMYGDGVIPGWEELIRWLEEAAVVGMAAWLTSFIRTHFARWRDRGASTPYAFLDIVLAREAWDRADLSQVLGISEREAVDLLTSLGFEPIDQVGRSRWIVSDDPGATALRKRILRDFMGHADADDDK